MVKLSGGGFWVGVVGRDEVKGVILFHPQAKLFFMGNTANYTGF